MSLLTDQQTRNDLELSVGNTRNSKVFALFNRTRTAGGAGLLEEFFAYPLTGRTAIAKRIARFRYFQETGMGFPFDAGQAQLVEQYLSDVDGRTMLSGPRPGIAGRLTRRALTDNAYETIRTGIQATLAVLTTLSGFTAQLRQSDPDGCYADETAAIQILLDQLFSNKNDVERTDEKLTHEQLVTYDRLFRFRQRDILHKLLRYIYEIDVFATVASVATQRGFTFPTVAGDAPGELLVTGLYHPLLDQPVTNNIGMDPESNVLFLTGANMAGKSTLMKAFGIALFLAHMGFPVPAAELHFTPMDGLFSSINLPDNLRTGESHFYAEVMRIKKIALELHAGRRLFVIFDELFRGTNVKDAHEATVAIIRAFIRRTESLFVISTHIMEAGETLQSDTGNIRFLFLPTRMEGETPVYTYRLEKGITADRHGMVIVRNEGILDLLHSSHKEQCTT